MLAVNANPWETCKNMTLIYNRRCAKVSKRAEIDGNCGRFSNGKRPF